MSKDGLNCNFRALRVNLLDFKPGQKPANRIVEAHGGLIEFRNRSEGGAEFAVVLPVGTEKSVGAARTESAASADRARDSRAAAVT